MYTDQSGILQAQASYYGNKTTVLYDSILLTTEARISVLIYSSSLMKKGVVLQVQDDVLSIRLNDLKKCSNTKEISGRTARHLSR